MFTSRLMVGTVVVALAAALAAAIAGEVTSALTLFGFLAVAIITAAAADARQARQLGDEMSRLVAQLTAERDRHRWTLMHDRELADLADLRSILDAAAVALPEGDEAILELELTYRRHGAKLHEQAPETHAELGKWGRELQTFAARLTVRLDRESRVVVALRAAVEHLNDVFRETRWLEDDTPDVTRGRQQTVENTRYRYEAQAARFREAAVELAGTRHASSSTALDEPAPWDS